jgi:hypothetical protein
MVNDSKIRLTQKNDHVTARSKLLHSESQNYAKKTKRKLKKTIDANRGEMGERGERGERGTSCTP